jgi:hypothetical protein
MFVEVVEVDEVEIEVEPGETRVQLVIFEPTSGRSLKRSLKRSYVI